ncbi:MAG: hypothetical protein ACHQHN_19575 [Sphingobacteriales bacterium]
MNVQPDPASTSGETPTPYFNSENFPPSKILFAMLFVDSVYECAMPVV